MGDVGLVSARRTARRRTLAGLRLQSRELHVLFARAMTSAARCEPPIPECAASPRSGSRRRCSDGSGRAAVGPARAAHIGRAGWAAGIAVFTVTVRVALATLIAGAIGAVSGIDNAYWAMSSAVLVLYQEFDFPRTVQRGTERLLGTVVGLVVTGALLAANPQGLWLVLIVMAMQFTIELVVARNYALAVVFITPTALVISTGGRPVDDVANLMITRVVDTVIGVAVGMAVYAATMAHHRSPRSGGSGRRARRYFDRTLVALRPDRLRRRRRRRPDVTSQRKVIALERSYLPTSARSIRSRDTAE